MPADARRPDLAELAGGLEDAGVPCLVLADGAPATAEPAAATVERILQLLIPHARRGVALDRFETLDWRYSWARRGLIGRLPMVYGWWDGGTHLEMCWGVPAAPAPSRLFHGLERALWRSAERAADGLLRPSPAALLAYGAVQSARPAAAHDGDWLRFVAQVPRVDVDDARAVAARAGVASGLERALSRAAGDGRRPLRSGVFDQPARNAIWRLALSLQARAGPARSRRVLAGAPWPGDAEIRCRVAGVEVRAGPGIFVPTPDADLFVEAATDWLAGREVPVVVEVGTGSGAIACALGAARPDALIHATELSGKAARSARRNAARLGLGRVHVGRGSLLDPVPAQLHGRIDLVIANLPFYPDRRYASIGSVERDTIQGPGADGLGLVRELVRRAAQRLRPQGRLLLQMFSEQWETFAGELEATGYRPGPVWRTGPFVIAAADRAD